MTPRAEPLLWFLAALALYAGGAHDRVFAAGNDASRWAQIESLVDHGRADIGASRFRATVDRVRIGAREYSNKPPAFSLAAAGVYAGVRAVTGWSLSGPGAGAAIRAVTILVVGVPSALLVAGFRRRLDRLPRLALGDRRWLTLALAAGTLLWSFSVTLNNHTVAAALLFAAFAAAVDGRALAAGLAGGLAAAVDLVPGFGLAPFLAVPLLETAPGRGRRLALWSAGFALGAFVLVAANLAVVGSIWTPKLVPGAVDFSAQAGPSVAGVVLPQSWTYPLECLFGGHGLFTVSPVLLVGAAGLAVALRRAPFGDRRLWAALAAGIVLQTVGHALFAGSYGGWSYGFRYLVPIQPLLLLAAGGVLAGRVRALFLALLPLSVLFAGLGAYHPWPPGFEQVTARNEVADLVTNPIGGNAAALVTAQAPGSAAARLLGERFVSADPAARRRYYALFFRSKGDLATAGRFGP